MSRRSANLRRAAERREQIAHMRHLATTGALRVAPPSARPAQDVVITWDAITSAILPIVQRHLEISHFRVDLPTDKRLDVIVKHVTTEHGAVAVDLNGVRAYRVPGAHRDLFVVQQPAGTAPSITSYTESNAAAGFAEVCVASLPTPTELAASRRLDLIAYSDAFVRFLERGGDRPGWTRGVRNGAPLDAADPFESALATHLLLKELHEYAPDHALFKHVHGSSTERLRP